MYPNDPPAYHGHPYEPQRRGMSSGAKWTMGCGLGCLFTLLIVAGGLYWTYTKAKEFGVGMLNQFTSETAQTFPVPEAEPAQVESLVARFDSFGQAMNERRDAEALVLTGDEINLLINNHPEMKEMAGKAQVEIVGDKLFANISVPLGDMGEAVKGRYLNGRASIRLFLLNGTLQGFIDDVEVNGMKIPAPFMAQLKSENIFKGANQDPKFQSSLGALEDLKIENGQIIIVPKPAAERPAEPPAEAPPGTTPGAESEAEGEAETEALPAPNAPPGV